MSGIHVTRQSGPGSGKARHFPGTPVSLGTAPGCDYRFDPSWDRAVASSHAYIERTAAGWFVRDAGSAQGTFVNGRRITKSEPVGEGCEIELGQGGPRLKVAPEAESLAAHSGTSPAPGAPASGGSAQGGDKLGLVALAAGLIALVGVAAWFLTRGGGSGNTDHAVAAVANEKESAVALAAVAKEKESAVALVVLSGKDRDGKPITEPMATAWAIGENLLATNTHVTDPVARHIANGGAAFVTLNKLPGKQFRIVEAKSHPKAHEELANIQGKDPAVPPYDVGLLRVEGTLPTWFKVADKTELEQIDSGYRVAYLGFPMEGLAGGGVDWQSPVATMQSGIVTSATDFWLSKADFPQRLLISHSLGATGGASGSPIFNVRGEVIGILSAGNIIGQVSYGPDGELAVQRAPSGVMINFGQRVDMLAEIHPAWPGK